MSFNVQPAAIDVFAAGMTSLADETTVATEYVDTHLNLVGFADSGIFLNILGSNNEAKGVLRTMISRVEALSAGSGGADPLRGQLPRHGRVSRRSHRRHVPGAGRGRPTARRDGRHDPTGGRLAQGRAGGAVGVRADPRPRAVDPLVPGPRESVGRNVVADRAGQRGQPRGVGGRRVRRRLAGRADRRQGGARARRLHPVLRDRDPGRGRHDAHALERQRRRGRRALLRRPGRGDRRADTGAAQHGSVVRNRRARHVDGGRRARQPHRNVHRLGVYGHHRRVLCPRERTHRPRGGRVRDLQVRERLGRDHRKAGPRALLVRGLRRGLAGYLGAVRGLDAQPLPAGSYDYPGA